MAKAAQRPSETSSASGEDSGPASTARAIPDDIASLRYEQARDELVRIVARLEAGQLPLEESLTLWERGEALAAHCQSWLDQAEQRLAGGAGAEDEAGAADGADQDDDGDAKDAEDEG
ncbi:exodeoxyribonuclease VII small subunit [Arsenicicoccus piscis]|uniref:Exodeoxyribonuclease 7 small subunit n=1 Tax=Arsenicicoccus piscis TaxID=673954 RepID=A0ABQ6HLI6_9MICO|nr:exodeoxyribonuclease VII small subunit [Arsenicicoccus piscis]MCH8627842.1 exodeoxyribonuclease VII small subunit [Arsenicicoccus piscis]GMA18364.1 hypothetical protein GCM10025862_03850 [Arsenicicoccus piscis]